MARFLRSARACVLARKRIGFLGTPIRARGTRGYFGNGGRVSLVPSPSDRRKDTWAPLWRGFGEDAKRRMQPMPGWEAVGWLPCLCRRRRGTDRYPGFAGETGAGESGGNAIEPASRTSFPRRKMVV